MKRAFTLILALVLCLVSACACAGGLDGLKPTGGKALPDPAEVTGKSGMLYSADYAFADDYLCDAYTYEPAGSTLSFMDDYTVLCRKAGFSVTATLVDGLDGYSIQDGSGLYAMLVPEFGDQMLLLVQKGMNFELKKKVNYATCVYNDREYELTLYGTELSNYFKWFSITFAVERAPFEHITIYFPEYTRSGDAYYSDKTKKAKGFGVNLDDMNIELLRPEGLDHINGTMDYASLEIHKLEDVDEGILIEGVFDGCFNKGEMVFRDFVFSAIVEL